MSLAADSGRSARAAAPPWVDSPRTRVAVKLLLALAMVLVTLYRRPDQFLHANLWVEDATVALPHYVAHGWMSLFDTIAGYYCLPVKVLHALSALLSFRWMPEAGFVLSLVFMYTVLAAIALAPTLPRMPFVCAAVVPAIPSDSEVFAVSPYRGWWGSLLVLLPLLWRTGATSAWTVRSALLFIGGFSSPLIIALLPFYALRAAVLRHRIEIAMACAAAAIATAQAFALHTSASSGPENWNISPQLIIEKFFGYFLLAPDSPGMPDLFVYVGAALLLFLLVCGTRNRRELGLPFLLLAGCLAAGIFASVRRAPLEALHPKIGGPRYFFFPYVILSWMLVQILAVKHGALAIAATVLLAIAGRNAIDSAQRRHTPIDWRAEVETCLNGPAGQPCWFSAHFDGSEKTKFRVIVSRNHCEQLVRGSLLDNRIP